MESRFSQEKSIFISRVGKEKVGAQIRIRGEHILKQLYAGKKEIKEIVQELGTDYDREQIKKELEALAYRTQEESKSWNVELNQKLSLEQVLAKGRGPLKKKPKAKKEDFVG